VSEHQLVGINADEFKRSSSAGDECGMNAYLRALASSYRLDQSDLFIQSVSDVTLIANNYLRGSLHRDLLVLLQGKPTISVKAHIEVSVAELKVDSKQEALALLKDRVKNAHIGGGSSPLSIALKAATSNCSMSPLVRAETSVGFEPIITSINVINLHTPPPTYFPTTDPTSGISTSPEDRIIESGGKKASISLASVDVVIIVACMIIACITCSCGYYYKKWKTSEARSTEEIRSIHSSFHDNEEEQRRIVAEEVAKRLDAERRFQEEEERRRTDEAIRRVIERKLLATEKEAERLAKERAEELKRKNAEEKRLQRQLQEEEEKRRTDEEIRRAIERRAIAAEEEATRLAKQQAEESERKNAEEKRRRDEEASKIVECCICREPCNREKNAIACDNPDPKLAHYYCNASISGCFDGLMQQKRESLENSVGLLAIACSMGNCKCSFKLKEIPKHCDERVYQAYVEATVDMYRNRALVERDQDFFKKMVENPKEFHALTYRRCIEDILTDKCPVCKTALDFDTFDFGQCMVISCKCGTHICGWCRIEISNKKDPEGKRSEDAHYHVRVCPQNPMYVIPEVGLKTISASREEFFAFHDQRKSREIEELLHKLPKKISNDVRRQIQRSVAGGGSS